MSSRSRVDNVYNAFATLGEVSVFVQAISCVALAAVLIVVGSMLVGQKGTQITARVMSTEKVWNAPEGMCILTVSYTFDTVAYTGTMVSSVPTSPGEDISIRVNPRHPDQPYQDLPWTSYGMSMISTAVLALFAAHWGIKVVSERKNLAAMAGVFSFAKALL